LCSRERETAAKLPTFEAVGLIGPIFGGEIDVCVQ
jgi:hypothetical protein